EPERSPLLRDLSAIESLAPLVANFRKVCRAPLAQVPTLNGFLNGETPTVTMPSSFTTSDSLAGLYRVFDAPHNATLLQQAGNRVMIVGKVTNVQTIRTGGVLSIFLDFGDWQKGCVSVVLWGNLLEMFQQQRLDPLKFQGLWISVAGLVSLYENKGANKAAS